MFTVHFSYEVLDMSTKLRGMCFYVVALLVLSLVLSNSAQAYGNTYGNCNAIDTCNFPGLDGKTVTCGLCKLCMDYEQYSECTDCAQGSACASGCGYGNCAGDYVCEGSPIKCSNAGSGKCSTDGRACGSGTCAGTCSYGKCSSCGTVSGSNVCDCGGSLVSRCGSPSGKLAYSCFSCGYWDCDTSCGAGCDYDAICREPDCSGNSLGECCIAWKDVSEYPPNDYNCWCGCVLNSNCVSGSGKKCCSYDGAVPRDYRCHQCCDCTKTDVSHCPSGKRGCVDGCCVECDEDNDCSGYDSTSHTKLVCNCPAGSSGCSMSDSSKPYYTCQPKPSCSVPADCDNGWCCTSEILPSSDPNYGKCWQKGIYTNNPKYLCDPPEGFVSSPSKKLNLFDYLLKFNPFSKIFS
jgi:hypothetical protein